MNETLSIRLRVTTMVRLLLTLSVLACGTTSHAEDPQGIVGGVLTAPTAGLSHEPNRLAIVIDDLGYSRQRDQRALMLPGELTFAVLPAAPNARDFATSAVAAGKEIILHQPMQTVGQPHVHEQGALHSELSQQQFTDTLSNNLRALPGIVGLNNHRGSLLTASTDAMDQVMAQLAGQNLYFLDSRTTAATVAHDTAKHWGVPTLKRDVFLDHVRTPQAVAAEFRRALGIARKQGFAVLIAHPHTVSLDYLEQALRDLPADIETVTLSELLPATNSGRRQTFGR
ncbi:MAG: divergent polysaccharide deacetylase family protein [Pseudomonadales bacterium]